MNEIIGQILGIVATIITAISYQVNNKRGLLAVQSAATLSTCLGYLFLGAMSGFALNIVCLVRNGVFFFFDKNQKGMAYRIAAVLLAICMVVLGAISWQGWVSLLIIVALALNTQYGSIIYESNIANVNAVYLTRTKSKHQHHRDHQ